MSQPDTQAANNPIKSVMYGRESHVLLSAYPLTHGIVQRIAVGRDVAVTDAVCLGDLKRRSLVGIYRALRKISADHVWVVISDRGFQPMLPILTLLAALTRGRKLHVIDFSGNGHSVSRTAIMLCEPLKLLWGSFVGLLCVWHANHEARGLARSKKMPMARIPDNPRVAYLKTNLWLGVQAGGSVGHIAGVVNGFARYGCIVDVFSGEEVPLLDSIVHFQRVSGTIFGGLPLETSGYQFHRLFCRQARKYMSGNPPDFVYQRACLANYSGTVLARRFGVPLILEYNGSEVWIAQHWGTPLRFYKTAKLIEEINLRHAHLIIVVSRVLQEELLRRGIEEDRILYYPNCVDPKIFSPGRFSTHDCEQLRDQLHIPRNAIVCSFLGTFGPWHGADVLAEAIRHMAVTRPSWLQQNTIHFLFVGDGQLLPKIRGILKDVPANLVTLAGLVPQNEAPRYLAASDILVSPHVPNADGSRFFGSPTKLFEYMAMAKPIIASDLEQLSEVLSESWHIGRQGIPREPSQLHGSHALLTKPASAVEIEQAIDYLVGHPEARAILGKAVLAKVLSRYTWQQQVATALAHVRNLKESKG